MKTYEQCAAVLPQRFNLLGLLPNLLGLLPNLLGLLPILCGELPSAGERDGEILGEPPLDENVPLSLVASLDAPHARRALA